MARFSSPSQPAFDTADNPDPAAEAGQRVAAGAQAAQGVLSTWALHTQRQMSYQRAEQAGHRGDQRTGEARRRLEVRDAERTLRSETREASAAAIRPLSMLDAGLDSLGPDSVLTEAQQAQVRRRFEVVRGGDVAERTDQLRAADAADEASESGALLSAVDGTPATVALLGGTNRRAARSARVREALGEVSEVSAVEALERREDPLVEAAAQDDVLGSDPLTSNAWDEPATGRGRGGGRDR